MATTSQMPDSVLLAIKSMRDAGIPDRQAHRILGMDRAAYQRLADGRGAPKRHRSVTVHRATKAVELGHHTKLIESHRALSGSVQDHMALIASLETIISTFE